MYVTIVVMQTLQFYFIYLYFKDFNQSGLFIYCLTWFIKRFIPNL